MEGIYRDITIGAMGSLLASLFIVIGQTQIKVRKNAIAQAKKEKEREIKLWKSMNMGIRQGITNKYVFLTLRYLFIGNMLWIGAESIPILFGFIGRIVLVVIKCVSFIFFYMGLGNIMSYMKLRELDDEYKLDKIANIDSVSD